MENLGRTIFKHLHSISWEVREYKMSKLSVASTSSSKPVFDSSSADVTSLQGLRNFEVRNSADISKTIELIMSVENGKVNSVLEAIRETDDITLLTNTYNSNLYLDSKLYETTSTIDENLFKTFATVTANDFLDYIIITDLKRIVAEKSKSIHHTETFTTLLEDVLRSFGKHDDIELDCY